MNRIIRLFKFFCDVFNEERSKIAYHRSKHRFYLDN